MTTWAATLGFSHATPEGKQETRAERGGVDLPEVNPAAQYLLEAYLSMGPTYNIGMGPTPLPFAEIAAAAPWADKIERHTIREMSVAYLRGLAVGRDPFGKHPEEWG